MIGMVVRDVDGRQGLLRLEQLGDEAVRIREIELGVDQDRIVLARDDRRVDEEARRASYASRLRAARSGPAA